MKRDLFKMLMCLVVCGTSVQATTLSETDTITESELNCFTQRVTTDTRVKDTLKTYKNKTWSDLFNSELMIGQGPKRLSGMKTYLSTVQSERSKLCPGIPL